jgi:hypothetical protein
MGGQVSDFVDVSNNCAHGFPSLQTSNNIFISSSVR